MRKTTIFALAAVAALAFASTALAGFGIGANVAAPTGDFGDFFKAGYGIHAVYQQGLTPLATLTGDFGWTTFSSEDVTIGSVTIGGEDIDVWNATAGARFAVLPLGLGAEVGYFSEVEEWSFVPTAGMTFSKIDLSARWKATGDAKWFEVRAAFMF
ncbi:MAG TPA: hypothetical protein PLQ13_14480 [Candidatus Krumholzibacteria bacterium]|nr:hypothetical protein [Candidatus Krumholzibacteria bacterium]